MADHTFCRLYLKTVMGLVKKHVPKAEIKKAWAWGERRSCEFHGPDNFYWYGQADCLYDAKAQGWTAYLTKIGKYEYEEEK